MIGGSTTNNGLPTYTRKSDFQVLLLTLKGINDDLGTVKLLMAGVLMFILENSSLVETIIVYPHTAAIPAKPKPNPFLFLAATDKTNNPTAIHLYTKRSARNVLC
jgi:hypothetical protein